MGLAAAVRYLVSRQALRADASRELLGPKLQHRGQADGEALHQAPQHATCTAGTAASACMVWAGIADVSGR